MTTKTQILSRADAQSSILPIIGAAFLGMFLLYSAGFAEASVLHDAAHDTRHSIAFPCH
jgi:cobalt transporter subunit CbtB